MDKNWELELEEYIRQGEPEKKDKRNAWKTAIGLQDVDGLKISDYLLETAKEHIDGKISITEVDKRIHSYYEERKDRDEIELDTKEADIVSVRIAKLLGEKTFQFSPIEWQNLHLEYGRYMLLVKVTLVQRLCLLFYICVILGSR